VYVAKRQVPAEPCRKMHDRDNTIWLVERASGWRDGHLVDLHDVLERRPGRDQRPFVTEVVAEPEARRDDHPPLAAGLHGPQHDLNALAHAPRVRPGPP
jgi:hypothetical protein